jgi:putative DNA primase/helicase
MTGVNANAIPQELRDTRQWIVWKRERVGERTTKVPYNPQTGRKASTTNPHSWSTFEQTCHALRSVRKRGSNSYDGVGFVFSNDYIGVDLDHCVESDGKFKPWAQGILDACTTYQEFSPSGTGIHLYFRGKLSGRGLNQRKFPDGGAIEIYSKGRYFTVTGNHVNSSLAVISDAPDYILDLYSKLGKKSTNGTGATTQASAVHSDSIASQLEIALRDTKFARLWHGDTSGHNGDDSAADLALCNKLAYYFGSDPAIIDSLFRLSGLMRKKWDRDDYRQSTIALAIEGVQRTMPSLNSRFKDPKLPEGDLNEQDHEELGNIPTRYSEDSLADQFSAREEGDLRFVPQWGWLLWTGQRWQRVSDVLIMERARPVCREVANQCKTDPQLKPSTQETLSRSIASAKTVAAVERLARGDGRHFVAVDLWDADLWLFNTPGGTIDLRTGDLRPHRRDDRITKISNSTPQGDCPTWLEYLDQITGGDESLARYLQRLAGYALVGDPREECLDFFYGEGGNGKGTFLSTLQYAFGEYATTAAVETFIESKGDKHPCDLAKLAGVRLVVANEVDEGQHWDEARIKNLTGRDVMTARFMRQDFFDFLPQFTLIVAGNHKPALKTIDESIRRRFRLVPFNVTIPADQRNTKLKDQLRAEADGVLRWAVEGCLEWQKQGLNPPEAVLAATADYLETEDVFGMWLVDCCERRSDYDELSALLYESYRLWKAARDEKAGGHKAFSTKLIGCGCELIRDRKARKVSGIRLTDTERALAASSVEQQRASRRRRKSDA